METNNNPFKRFEDNFDKKFGYSDKFICCKSKHFSQIISITIVCNAFLFFIQTFYRWGAPCFLWWYNVSTTLTFVIGHSTRFIGIIVGIYSFLKIRNEKIIGSKVLFNYLILLSLIIILDLFLCLFEVHDVCNSYEIKEWNKCSHEWGKQQYECVENSLSHINCNVNLNYEIMNDDKNICNQNINCSYVEKSKLEREKSSCCSDSLWIYYNPCDEPPIIRKSEFDATWCEEFSDLYDLGINLITILFLGYFSYVVHSHNVMLSEEIKFMENPMEEFSD